MQKTYAKDTAQKSKPDYQAILHRRAAELLEQLKQTDGAELEDNLIFQCLKQTALESWRNGLEAGRRRSAAERTARSKTTGSTQSA